MLTITAYIEQTEPWSLGERGWRIVRFKLAQSNIILKDMKEERTLCVEAYYSETIPTHD